MLSWFAVAPIFFLLFLSCCSAQDQDGSLLRHRLRAGEMMNDNKEDMMGGGMMGMVKNHGSMRTIHQLLDHRDEIHRNVTFTSGFGAVSKTWSTNQTVDSWIESHVKEMILWMQDGSCIHQCDPLFKALCRNHEKMELKCQRDNSDGKWTCSHTSYTQCGQDLVESHSALVTAFIERGFDEVHSRHPAPESCHQDS